MTTLFATPRDQQAAFRDAMILSEQQYDVRESLKLLLADVKRHARVCRENGQLRSGAADAEEAFAVALTDAITDAHGDFVERDDGR